ncbi:MAG TPA: NAD-dependent epimerase/dehydratase family protein [Myxococcaceae bacterium]|nr:NAD-dependent epimerase/dehydratase family protein [Myxococcaceae bacterium]
MQRKRVLITGGAGFIGSHLADHLLARGYRVRALDSLVPEVHGEYRRRPGYLASDVELVRGDVRDRRAVNRALRSVDAVFHFAASGGVGRSIHELAQTTSINNLGTAVLLEALSRKPVEKLVVASSMSIYGEGMYRTPEGEVVEAQERSLRQLQAGCWEPTGPNGECLEPLPTPETKSPTVSSVWALGKHDQERLCLMIGRAHGIPTVALRFFNVYGPRQALSNPHTGVLALFASRLLDGNAPLLFEDGLQQRDFVSVHDVVRACRLALESAVAAGRAFNVGSGSSMSIRTVAAQMAEALGRRQLRPEITGKYRIGDVRHCFADTMLAAKVLGYEARVSFTEGLLELSEWLAGQHVGDRIAEMGAHLDTGG